MCGRSMLHAWACGCAAQRESDVTDIIFPPMVSVRSNWAVHHLRAAVDAARKANQIEQEHPNDDHGPWFDGIMIHVPVAIIMAGAALEASANEIIQDILDNPAKWPITGGVKTLIKDLKEERAGSTVEKFRRVALFLDKVPEQGTPPWENAGLLVDFRNRLMHFKPAWDYETNTQDKLVQALKGRVPIYRAYKSDFRFPYVFMTYGCAKWAITTVLIFYAHLSALIGVKDKFAADHLDLSLPESVGGAA
jgi:hypothetical protein